MSRDLFIFWDVIWGCSLLLANFTRSTDTRQVLGLHSFLSIIGTRAQSWDLGESGRGAQGLGFRLRALLLSEPCMFTHQV